MLLFKSIFKGKGGREEKEIEEEIGKVRQQRKDTQKIREILHLKEYMARITLNKDIIKSQLASIYRIPKCPAHLCIFELEAKIAVYVMPDKNKNAFDDFYKKNIKIERGSAEGDINIMNLLDIMPINNPDKLKKDWVMSIRDNNESIVKEYGEDLWNKLIPKGIKEMLEAELEIDNDKIKDVWIFCEEENIDYPWEGIHWGNFYWGDRFHIVRIPEGRIPENCKSDNQNIQIKKIAVIIDEDCDCTDSDMEYFNKLSEKKKEIISLQNEEDLNKLDLKGVDSIHVVASIDTIEEKGNLRDLFEDAFNKLDNKPKFLFLNIRSRDPVRAARDYINLPEFKNIFIRAVDIWIDTSFGLQDDISPGFAKEFYEVLESCKKNQKNVTEVVTEAREKMDCKRFCRLAYMVFGNPCNTVSWDVS